MVPNEAQRRFELPVFPPPFDMVLPEGERRAKIESARKIVRTDSFSLLSYVGGNPVNRVQFLAPDQMPGAPPPEKCRPNCASSVAALISSRHSTSRFPFLAANEFLCLGVLARAGIRVPRTTLSADGQLLLVDRFDIESGGHLKGFEEAAALMGETSETKYQRDVGSMIEVLCDFIRQSLTRPPD